LTRAERARRKAIVERARLRLPDLPTAALYRITALLERALASAELESNAYEELERALRRRRPTRK
jgi:hypothetical protein